MKRASIFFALLFLLQPEVRPASQGSASHPEIYIMTIDGTGLRNLANHPADDQEPEFAPGGQRPLFDSDRKGERRHPSRHASTRGPAGHPAVVGWRSGPVRRTAWGS
jgi:hypothetical protein